MFQNGNNTAVQLSTLAEELFNGIAEVATDEITPVAFSAARIFRQPEYMLYMEVRHSRAMRGDYTYFAIVKHTNGDYDLDSPVYESSNIEDIADVWQIFK